MHVNYIYCGNHFAIYIHIQSLCCTPKTMLWYVNYISKQNKTQTNKGGDLNKAKLRANGLISPPQD